MRKGYLIAILLLMAGTAFGTTPADIQGGLVPEGEIVDLTGLVVTSVLSSSFTVTDLPAGPNQALWVLTGPAPAVAVGDVVDLRGRYIEHEGTTTIFSHGFTVTARTEAPELFVTAYELVSDPEGYESCVLMVTDGLVVNEILPDGDWLVVSFEDGVSVIRIHAYWYDASTVEPGQCYNNALGLFAFHDGAYRLKAFEGGLALTDCTVGDRDLSFGGIKALYR